MLLVIVITNRSFHSASSHKILTPCKYESLSLSIPLKSSRVPINIDSDLIEDPLLDGAQVHGLLNDVVVVGDVKLLRIDRLLEGPRKLCRTTN